jgi:acetyl esterase/lipase
MNLFPRVSGALILGLGATVMIARPSAAADTAPSGGGGATASVEVVRDLPYFTGEGADPERNKLDLYLPAGKKGFATLLFFHGGGYSKGDRKDVEAFGRTLAGRGIAVAAVGYRLFPAHKHPAQAQDAARALAWVKSDIAKRGGRADLLFIGGHSAGAHLALLVGTDESYLKEAGASAADVKGVVSLSGGFTVGEKRADLFGDEAARKKASPSSHVRAGLPPFLLAYADKDAPGRDKETHAFAESLKAVGVRAEVLEAKDRDHGGLFTKISGEDPVGSAVAAFVSKIAADAPAGK